MTVAEVGKIVEFYDGLRGRVEKINDNSVIVDLTIMENFNELEWIKLGLMYFHNLDKSFFNQMDSINYRGLNDGFEVRFGDQQYWIPKLLV